MNLRTMEQAIAHYGPIVDGKWTREAEFCSLLEIPDEIGAGWINSMTGHPVVHIYCNKDMQAALLGALQNVLYRGMLGILHSYDGCLNRRFVRGSSSRLSWHYFGLAIDLDASENKMGTPGNLPPEFVRCFTDVGFVWGGHFHSRTDPMHFQFGIG